jgi:hypothetical protein
VGPFRDAFEAAFSPAEAAVHRLESRLYRALRKRVSREEAAGVFAAEHARTYAEGDFGDFRLPDLLVMAEQAGVMVEVTAQSGTPADAEATDATAQRAS